MSKLAIVEAMSQQFLPDYRISDAERQQAMDDLGAHFAAGRLDLAEYEKRLDVIAAAVMRTDILPLFDDLPARTAPTVAAPNQGVEKVYTASEIAHAYNLGRNVRAGTVALATLGTVGIQIALGIHEPIFLLVGAIVFVLMYIMKIGPKSWHTPNPRKLERERLRYQRSIQAQQLQQIHLMSAQQRAAQKAIRQQKQAELTHNAMELADQMLKRFKK